MGNTNSTFFTAAAETTGETITVNGVAITREIAVAAAMVLQETFLGTDLLEKADLFGSHPEDRMEDKVVYYSSSIGAAFEDLSENLIVDRGHTLLLYGAPGSGVSTTMHAVVRGERNTMGCRGLVLQAEKSKTGKEWFSRFRKSLGKNWDKLEPDDVADKLFHLIRATYDGHNRYAHFFGFTKLEESYDPSSFPSNKIAIHGYNQETSPIDNPAPVIGIDNVDFEGDRCNPDNEAAFEFLERLVMEAKHMNIILIIGTHNKRIVDDASITSMKTVKHSLASIQAKGGKPAPSGVDHYDYLKEKRKKNDYELIDNLRMDAGRKELLFKQQFSGGGENKDVDEAIKKAANEPTLVDSYSNMKAQGIPMKSFSPSQASSTPRSATRSGTSNKKTAGWAMNDEADAYAWQSPLLQSASTATSTGSGNGGDEPWSWAHFFGHK